MKFGYLESLDSVDFTLPKDHPFTGLTLQKSAQNEQNLFIGTAQWSERSFVGRIYPKKVKPSEYLTHYARQFNSIELNATRYGIPKEDTLKNWRESVPADFKFCLKFPRYITHRRQIDPDKLRPDIERFTEAIKFLGINAGMSLLQLPPAFGPSRISELAELLSSLPPSIELAIELRHPDFFSQRDHLDTTYHLLNDNRASLVITDVPGRRDVLHQMLSIPKCFVRINGYKLHPSDYKRIEYWHLCLDRWFSQGLETAYFFIHQQAPMKFTCLDLAVDLGNRFDKHETIRLRYPQKNYKKTPA